MFACRIASTAPESIASTYDLNENLVVKLSSGMVEIWQLYSITEDDITPDGYNILTIRYED